MEQYYLAIDIGASSGRHILGHMEDGKMVLEEMYRFPNGMTEENGQKSWNVKALFRAILEGMKKCKEAGKIPVSMGILAKDAPKLFSFWIKRIKCLEMQSVIGTAVPQGWMRKSMRSSRKKSYMREQASRSRFSTPFIS